MRIFRDTGTRFVLAVVAGLLAASSGGARSETRDFYFQRIAEERGLAQKTVTAIVQDPQGFVWVGTEGGLHRYDGQRYRLYRGDPRNPDSLPDNHVTALDSDGAQALWIGTSTQYVARLDLRNGRIHRYQPTLRDPAESSRRQVRALAFQPGRGLWIATRHGLERLDPGNGRQRQILALPPSPALPRQALLADAGGVLWYSTPQGLYRIDGVDRTQRIGPALPALALHRDGDGRLWLGNAQGLYRIDAARRELIRHWPAAGAAAQEVTAITSANDGYLWAAVGRAGLRRIAVAGDQVDTLLHDRAVPGSLPDDAVGALMMDNTGLLWVGSEYRGIAITDSHGARFPYVYDPALLQAGDMSVRAMAESVDGQLWLATDLGHLLRYRRQDGQLEDFGTPLPQGDTEAASRITAFTAGDAGNYWLATTVGLYRFDGASGALTAVPLPGDVATPNLRAVVVAADGTLWLGALDTGLFHFDPAHGEVQRYTATASDPARRLSHWSVLALLLDRSGRLWIGTGDGLDLLADGKLQHFRYAAGQADSLPGNIVRALLQGGDGRLWVGTQAGLAEILGDAAIRFAPASAQDAPEPAPMVYSIAEDAAHRLWMGTDVGLQRFDPTTRQLRRYTPLDGVQDLEFNGGSALRLRDGRLAIGGIRGINLFDPTRISDSRYAPPLRLLSSRIGDAPVDSDAQWSGQAPITMPQSAGILQLHLGTLDFADPAALRYRYQLEGYDKYWIDNGSRADITYTGLPPGQYRLRAQATNRDGLWNAQELTLPITVTPPPWRSPMALTLYALLALVSGALLAWLWLRRRRAERGYFEQIREREERLKIALWASGEHFWDNDLVANCAHVLSVEDPSGSDSAVRTLRFTNPDLEVHPDDLTNVRESMQAHLEGRTPMFLSEHRARGRDGKWIWIRARGRAVARDARGRVIRVAGTARDISDRRDADRERRIASEVLRSMNEAVSVLDENFVFVAVNPAFTRTTGYAEHEAIGHSASMLDSLQHDPQFYRDVRTQLVRDGHWSGEMWQQRKNGEEILCALETTLVEGAIDQRNLYVAVLSDITHAKRTEHELRLLANYDTLTNLPNRALLSERLSQAIVNARREDRRIAVLFLDLDRFKDVNDSLGHATGDRILRASAARLREVAPPGATVARLSGDEFTVLLEHLQDPEEADRLAERIIRAFEAPLAVEDRREIIISPSIGISLYPDHAQVPTDLLKHADTAMYQAKAAGRRTYQRYTEQMEWELRQRATLSGALRKVLENGELRLVYQPRVSLRTGEITGVEALLRWEHPYLGVIPPSHFIPLAEESGMILPIGEWVLREACTTLRRWRQHGLQALNMSVNVSALQLLRGDLPTQVARVLADTGIPGEHLELELTESVVMTKAAQAATTMQALRDLGVRLAIDDFGTGYSSLAYLKRLPITTLKIDKAFIDDIVQDKDDKAITSSIIAMAHTLGLYVVAEGVEHKVQAQLLLAQHCDEVQGYWVARPLDPYRCLAFLRNWQAGVARFEQAEPAEPA
ncbi:PAS domain S-box-containing protein/diguanylate cyclase (GGDEF)-like protein [Luteimonas cucumeris]|uniref:cyclic-guanylate-specific phosphodiesterase n=1 Tax=Luteimonas cucumeris TaxID=985012 RepID=A0A562LEZ2_9GAMM|nr:EAL domain-containing protein [Luteimonas cucumeris]TWI06177.1 PAS domain S-box-containing protein/diguanylate cyclase (GGDEF)-like protein [Luteimonas cucumeris]